MKKNKLLLAIVFSIFFYCNESVKAQNEPLYRFEGRAIALESSANLNTGNFKAVKYGSVIGTDKIKIYLSPGHNYSNQQSIVYNCDNSSRGTISGNSFIPINSESGGYFCFKSNDYVFKVDFGGAFGTTDITYDRWIADQPKQNISALGNTINYPFNYPFSKEGYNVRDFGAKGNVVNGAIVDDTAAIKNAVAFVASKQGGVLFFPAGDYYISDSIPLSTGITIKGVGGRLSEDRVNIIDYEALLSKIRINGENKAIFQIGLDSKDIKIRDLSLRDNNYSNSNYGKNIGIKAVGKNSSSNYPATDDLTVQRVEVTNVLFERLEYGIYVNGLDNVWQFDYVKIDHCSFFYNRHAGIFINTQNSDWLVTSSTFFSPAFSDSTANAANADGIRAQYAGNIQIESSYGHGGDYESRRGGDFIDVDLIQGLTVINSSTENLFRTLRVGGNLGTHGFSYPITFINNIFGDKIEIAYRINFVSIGNLYGANTFAKFSNSSNPLLPVGTLQSEVRIYSQGDRFCYDQICKKNAEDPTTAPLVANFLGGQIMFSTGQVGNLTLLPGTATLGPPIPGRPTVLSTDTQVELSFYNPNSNDFAKYKLSRQSNGWMTFRGSQEPRYTGYDFDGQLKLPSYTLAAILDPVNGLTGTVTPGVIVYCTNCVENTSPCQTVGTGALAVFSGNGNWKCK